MIRFDSRATPTARSTRWTVQAAIAGPLLLLATVAGCDSLLDVTLPGRVLEDDLNDPRLARTLVAGAQGDFDCTFSHYVLMSGGWAGEFFASDSPTGFTNFSTRHPIVATHDATTCETSLALGGNPWLSLHIARGQAESAIERIETFPAEEVPAKNFLIGKAEAYAGYAYLLIGEMFCEAYFDAGPRKTREETWRLAEERFTSSLEYASQVTSGPDVDEASSIQNMALVGRARALLNLGDGEGVLRDASEVQEGFVRYGETSEAVSRRYNHVYANNVAGRAVSVHFDYHDLGVEGVPDPRVPVAFGGVGGDQFSPWWIQEKYTSRGAHIPLATWREAQLMIAEVTGGQTAVDVINTLRATYGLPEFSSSDPGEIRAQVLEERRRELWIQGTRLGDMLRHDLPFLTGSTPIGVPYADLTCVPPTDAEGHGNPHAG